MMPVSTVSFRRKEHHSTWKANGVVSKEALNTGLTNGFCARTSGVLPCGLHYAPKPPHRTNDHVNNSHQVNGSKTFPKKFRTQGSRPPAAAHTPGAGDGVSTDGVPQINGGDHPCKSHQMKQDHSLVSSEKKEKRRRYFRSKKKTRGFDAPPSDALSPRPEIEENWEHETEEVTASNWEKMCFGVCPYGPEDLLHFTLRGLKLGRTESLDLPLTGNYKPVVHHPRPVKWSCYNVPTEPDQFADADD